jgi:hypothetical protein
LNTVPLWYVLIQGIVCALLGFFGVFVMNIRATNFLKGAYWKWLAGGLACALLGPITYMWMQDFQITLADAATLRVLRAGVWHVARGYGIFCGVLLGGAAGCLTARLRETRP